MLIIVIILAKIKHTVSIPSGLHQSAYSFGEQASGMILERPKGVTAFWLQIRKSSSCGGVSPPPSSTTFTIGNLMFAGLKLRSCVKLQLLLYKSCHVLESKYIK